MRISFFYFILIISIAACSPAAHKNVTIVIHSEIVKDSFELYIDTPANVENKKIYDIFYYLDANLKSGKKIRKYIQDSVINKKGCKTIYVGIGHIGDYHVLRRRDFTIPKIENGDTANLSENFGQAEKFYGFLTKELIPYINKTYPTSNNNSIFGHSFGGLFSIYCLFKSDTVFKNYYSLSPSLWVNNYSVYSFNHLTDTSTHDKNLFLSVGGMEVLNRIKPGADEFDNFLSKKKYSYLSYKYIVYKGKSHNSQVKYSIEEIFK